MKATFVRAAKEKRPQKRRSAEADAETREREKERKKGGAERRQAPFVPLFSAVLRFCGKKRQIEGPRQATQRKSFPTDTWEPERIGGSLGKNFVRAA